MQQKIDCLKVKKIKTRNGSQLDNETKDNVIFRFCHHSFLYFD